MKIGLDLAEILRISKLDWREGGEGEKGRRRGGILLCNGLICVYPGSITVLLKFIVSYLSRNYICRLL